MRQQLSPSKRAILWYIFRGYPNKAIAWETGYSEHTVVKYIVERMPEDFKDEPEIRAGLPPKTALVRIGQRYFEEEAAAGCDLPGDEVGTVSSVYHIMLKFFGDYEHRIFQGTEESNPEGVIDMANFILSQLADVAKTATSAAYRETVFGIMKRVLVQKAIAYGQLVSLNSNEAISAAEQLFSEFKSVAGDIDGLGFMCLMVGGGCWVNEKFELARYWVLRGRENMRPETWSLLSRVVEESLAELMR